MPRLRLGVLGLEVFWLEFCVDLTEKCGNASGFQVTGILVTKGGCPGGCWMHAGKRGTIKSSEPKALSKLGLDKNHWTTRVKGIGSGHWRVVGELEELIDKAKEIGQRTLYGIGFARILNKI